MKKTEQRREIINILKEKAFVPYNVIGILENRDQPVYADESNRTVWACNDYFNYITGDPKIILEHTQTLEDGFYGFSAVEDTLAQAVYKHYFLHWFEPTERYVYIDDVPHETSPYPVVSIDLEEAKGIDDRYEYQQDGSLERIKDAILHRPTSAIYIDDVISSYVLVHEDNSIGYMYTREEHRQKGLGYWVTLDILRKMKALNQVPFVEINKRNLKSQGLAGKTGFIKDAFTPWFGIIKGIPKWFYEWHPFEQESYFFTSMSHLVHVDNVTTSIEEVTFEKTEDGYRVSIDDAMLKADFKMLLDASNEAYIFSSHETYTDAAFVDIIKVLAHYFTDQGAAFVFPYREALKSSFTGLYIER